MLVALALGLHSGVHVGGGTETLVGRGLWRYYTSIFIPVYAYLEGVVVNLSVR